MASWEDAPVVKAEAPSWASAPVMETNDKTWEQMSQQERDTVEASGGTASSPSQNQSQAPSGLGAGLLAGAPSYAEATGNLIGGLPGMASGNKVLEAAGALTVGEAARTAIDGVVQMITGKYKTNAERLADSAASLTMNAAATTAMGAVGAASKNIAKGWLASKRAAEVLKDLNAASVDPAGAALVLGSNTVQGAMKMERSLPISSGWIQEAIKKTQDSIANFAERVAKQEGRTLFSQDLQTGEGTYKPIVGSSTKGTLATRNLLSEGEDAFVARMDAQAGSEYAKVEGLNQMPVRTDAVRLQAKALVDEIESKMGTAPQWLKNYLDPERLPDEVPFEVMRGIRSTLARTGRDITETAAGTSAGAAKRLTGTVDDVLEAAGTSVTKGDPAKFKAFRDANAIVKEKYAALEELAKLTDGKKGVDAWNAATVGAVKDPTKLNAMKKLLTPQEWTEFVGARIRDMGTETAAGGTEVERQFSPGQFLKSYRGLEKEAKDVAFGKPGTELREGVDRLARISQLAEESGMYANAPSGAQKLLTTATAGGIGAAGGLSLGYMLNNPLLTAAVGGATVGAHLYSAKLFTNPDFVRWLGDGVLIHPANYQGISAQIGKLSSITGGAWVRKAIGDYTDQLKENNASDSVRQVLTGKATSEDAEKSKPLLQKFQEARDLYAQQEAAIRSLPQNDQAAADKGLSKERIISRQMAAAGKQLDQLASLEENLKKAPQDASTSSNLFKLQQAKERLARTTLEARDKIYAKS